MQLDVVTPRGMLLSQAVDEVTAPGVLGEFGVLPGHIPFLTGLRAGVLRYRAGNRSGVLAVGPGFVQVSAGDRVVVLTDAGVHADGIDVVAAKHEVAEAQSALDHQDSDDPGRRVELEARRDWAQARIDSTHERLH